MGDPIDHGSAVDVLMLLAELEDDARDRDESAETTTSDCSEAARETGDARSAPPARA